MDNETMRQRLLSIKQMADECLGALGHQQERPVAPSSKPRESDTGVKDIGVEIANKIGECEDSGKLRKILNSPHSGRKGASLPLRGGQVL